jgi:hypothetical protein
MVTFRHRHAPRAPLPTTGVTSCGVTSCVTSEDITPPSSLIRAHGPSQNPLTSFGLSLVSESLQVAASLCWKLALPGVISAGPSLDAWALTPVGSYRALTRFFL